MKPRKPFALEQPDAVPTLRDQRGNRRPGRAAADHHYVTLHVYLIL
jgi:hypothetical protein